MTLSESLSIHQDLHFAISTLKHLDVADAGGFFYGQGERLEMMLAAASRIKMRSRDCEQPCMLRDRSQWAPLRSSAEDPASLTAALLSNEDTFMSLDEQLLKLTQAWPTSASQEASLEDIWQDIFSVLDTNALPV